MKRDLLEIYSYFITKLYKDQSYQFFQVRLTKKINIVMVNFLIELRDHISIHNINKEYLFEYCSYQFEYMFSKMPRYIDSRIPFSQIYSYKGIERWLQKSEGYMYYVGESLQQKGIDRRDIIKSSIITRDVKELVEQEESEKRRFYNQEKGLSHCIIATSLYNSDSDLCRGCLFLETCKGVLKRSSLSLYTDREHV